jgi:sulfate permease, SulP family
LSFGESSVVGGYLAFIGWFCGVSGIGLMANSSEVTIQVFFLSDDSIQKLLWVLPGIISGIAIYFSVITIRHMAVLPTFMLSLLVLFHVVLWCTGTSIQQATDNGWIRDLNMGSSSSSVDDSHSWTLPAWVHTWDYLKIQHVDWSVVPKIILTELSMIFVVALSSSLDVAAIDLELQEQAQKVVVPLTSSTSTQQRQRQQQQGPIVPLPLDYNHELQTVGISNVISGLTGGYTGSYIFSQSIFSLRAGIRSRLAGFVLAFCQFIVLILPIPVLSFVPNFLFGSLLTVICVDLMYEWLWHVRHKVSTTDYILAWLTFLAIQVFGNVQYGIITGIIVHVVYTNMILLWARNNDDNHNSNAAVTNNHLESVLCETAPLCDNINHETKSPSLQYDVSSATTTAANVSAVTSIVKKRDIDNYGSIS